MKNWLEIHWLKTLAIVMLIAALGEFPYAYYQLLDWVILGAAGTEAYAFWKEKKAVPLWIFILIAIVFNPIAPFNMTQLHWRMADLIVAAVFVASMFRKK